MNARGESGTGWFSSATSLNGSIFAYTANVSGSDFEISWKDNDAAEPDFEVNLK